MAPFGEWMNGNLLCKAKSREARSRSDVVLLVLKDYDDEGESPAKQCQACVYPTEQDRHTSKGWFIYIPLTHIVCTITCTLVLKIVANSATNSLTCTHREVLKTFFEEPKAKSPHPAVAT